MDPVPKRTEGWIRRIHPRREHERQAQRYRNENEEERGDEQQQDDMMVLRLTKLPLATKLIEDVEKAGKTQQL